jgi:hypothetical protein
MAIGPAIMALGVLWFVRIPSSSTPWHFMPGSPSTYIPPLSYITDLLPGGILFGIGLMMTVAPLTTALMTSVPSHTAGLASAINNAISRVGPQLAGAAIFIFITTSFYSSMASRNPGMDVTSADFRRQVSPLNPSGIAALAQSVKGASTDAFHLAMMVGAALLLAGALVNAVGIRNPFRAAARQPEAGEVPSVAKESA